MKRCIRYFLRNRDGSAAIEFAFIMPVLALIIMGLFESGRLYYINSNLQYAADEAGRYAIVNTTASNTTIEDQVRARILAVNPTNVAVTVQDQTISGKPFKQIALAYTFSTAVGSILNMSNINLTISSTVPVMP